MIEKLSILLIRFNGIRDEEEERGRYAFNSIN